jgi:chromosome partitioning protein
VKIFACYNLKGGVGKTATAVNLAYLSSVGARTLLWDLDPQASATFYLRVKAKVKGGSKRVLGGGKGPASAIRGSDFEGLDLLPADLSYRKMELLLDAGKRAPTRQFERLLDDLARDYDTIVLDCAPGISLVSEAVFQAADALLIPTIPTTLSVRTYETIAEHVDKRVRKGKFKGEPGLLLPFFCMVDRRKKMHREFLELSGQDDSPFLRTSIPYSSAVERMGTERAPLQTYAAASAPAKAYRELWWEVLERVRDR